ncbi:MAG: acyl-CoA dehydrogenase family protein [Clostridiales bacterium]|nr:acyl-CoA dehydrogenase family protein [Clostridiales bacterium]
MFEKKHEMLRKLAREFAEKELEPIAADAEKEGAYPKELWEKVAKYGFTGITIPEAYGGCGGDYKSLAIVVEEFCKKDAAASSLIMSNSLSGAPYLYYGTEEQKQKYLRPMVEGKTIGAFALTEPGAGSDSGATQTTCLWDEEQGCYILNGRKCFITMGPVCDYAVVFAKSNLEAKGTRGISAFIVEADWEGFSRGKTEEKMGMHASVTSDLVFNNVKVPKENLLGKEGQGFKIAMGILDAGRVTVAAQGLGIAAGCLDLAVEYSKERVQFGRPISKLQDVAFKLADMATEVEATRLLVYDVADKLDKKQKVTMQAAMAKYKAGEVCNQVAYKALQIHGGYGYMQDYAIERMTRAARLVSIYEGTSEIQKLVISGNLLK